MNEQRQRRIGNSSSYVTVYPTKKILPLCQNMRSWECAAEVLAIFLYLSECHKFIYGIYLYNVSSIYFSFFDLRPSDKFCLIYISLATYFTTVLWLSWNYLNLCDWLFRTATWWTLRSFPLQHIFQLPKNQNKWPCLETLEDITQVEGLKNCVDKPTAVSDGRTSVVDKP